MAFVISDDVEAKPQTGRFVISDEPAQKPQAEPSVLDKLDKYAVGRLVRSAAEFGQDITEHPVKTILQSSLAPLEVGAQFASGLGSSIVGGVVGPFKGGAAYLGTLAGGGGFDAAKQAALEESTKTIQDIQQAGTYDPVTSSGKLLSAYTSYPIAQAKEITSAIGGPLGRTIARPFQPDTPEGQAAVQRAGYAGEELLGIAPDIYYALRGGAGALEAAGKIPIAVAKDQAEKNLLRSGKSAKVEVIQNARKKGFKFTSDELIKYGLGSKTAASVEDVAGMHVYGLKETTAADLNSLANNKITENIIKDDMTKPNMKPVGRGMPFSENSLEAFRKEHGKVYAAIERRPEPVFHTTKFEADIKGIDSELSAMKEQYPDLSKVDGLDTLQQALIKGKPVLAKEGLNTENLVKAERGTEYKGHETGFGVPETTNYYESTNAAAAMQLIRTLRDKANTILKNPKDEEARALGKLQKKAANALEDLIGEHLKREGKDALFKAFQNSRKNIKLSYIVEEALKGGTTIDPHVISKIGKEEKLTGNFKIVSDMTSDFPDLMRDPRDIKISGGGHASSLVKGGLIAGFGTAAGTLAPAIAPASIATGIGIAARPWAQDLMRTEKIQNKITKPPSYAASAIAPTARAAIEASKAAIPAAMSAEAERARRKKERSKPMELKIIGSGE